MESHYWNKISHLTLTYTDEYLPINYTTEENLFYCYDEVKETETDSIVPVPTLNPRDLTLFIKRLRKSGCGELHNFRESRWNPVRDCYEDEIRIGIKYYGVGEYGTLKGRSHLHIVLFGIAASEENRRLIEKIWGKGRICLKPVFPETFGYVAGYVQKKLYGVRSNPFRLPEFMQCSQRLGKDWIEDHISTIDDDHCYIPFQGKSGKSFKYGIPRYFRDYLVEKGRLTKVSALGLIEQQKLELKQLSDDLRLKGIDERDFFRQRFKDCNYKFRKKQFRRNQTGDI